MKEQQQEADPLVASVNDVPRVVPAMDHRLSQRCGSSRRSRVCAPPPTHRASGDRHDPPLPCPPQHSDRMRDLKEMAGPNNNRGVINGWIRPAQRRSYMAVICVAT